VTTPDVIHLPGDYWIGVLGRFHVDGMIGAFATEAEAREALGEATIVVTGLPEGWHLHTPAGPVICSRCKPIEGGQLSQARKRDPHLDEERAGVFDDIVQVRDYPCPVTIKVVDGRVIMVCHDIGPVEPYDLPICTNRPNIQFRYFFDRTVRNISSL
jgi:hypothetical protein